MIRMANDAQNGLAATARRIGGDLLHGFECPQLIEEKVAKQ